MESPRVGPVESAQFAELILQLNLWRDSMPEFDASSNAADTVTGYAVFAADQIVGGYFLASIPMANEIVAIAVDPGFRRHGLGRLLCMDALFHSGKRPLVLTANDDSIGFAKAIGFKVFGKRKQPDGTVLTRLGWHAPRLAEGTVKR